MGETCLYSQDDMRCAAVRLRRCVLLTACPVLALTAVYVLGVLEGMHFLMLVVLLAGFAWAVFSGDLCLLPAWRYMSFLKDMEKGLRRRLDCTLERVSEETMVQDGVRVHSVQVRLSDGDSRMFYVNASKMDLLPPVNAQVELTSYGRHIVAFRLL